MEKICSVTEIGAKCRKAIEAAEADGLTIDDSNVVDLCADNINASLADIRVALISEGYGQRFPKATANNHEQSAALSWLKLSGQSDAFTVVDKKLFAVSLRPDMTIPLDPWEIAVEVCVSPSPDVLKIINGVFGTEFTERSFFGR